MASVNIYADFSVEDSSDSSTFGTLMVNGRVRFHTIRATANLTLTDEHHNVFCDTDGGAFTITLPEGNNGTEYRIVNTGTSGNQLTISPDGSENLIGVNSSITLDDSESIIIVYETTEGWY